MLSLEQLGVPHTEHRHAPVRNAAEAASAGLPFPLELLLKTLVFRTPEGWLLAVLRAADRIDYGALARTLGMDRKRIRFASDEELHETFGWQPGGAAPVTSVEATVVVVDDAVPAMPRIYFGGGRRDLTIEAEPAALLRRIPHRLGRIAK